MKILKELELRRNILLDQREKISLFSSFYGDIIIGEIDSLLFLLELKIVKVNEDKLYYYDNPSAFDKDIKELDLYINQYRALLN